MEHPLPKGIFFLFPPPCFSRQSLFNYFLLHKIMKRNLIICFLTLAVQTQNTAHACSIVNSGPRQGDPISAGRNCNGPNERVLGQRRGARYSIPDFIFGQAPLVPPGGRSGMRKTHFIAEVKSQASTLYGEYISPGRNERQLDAILGYSRKHTDLRIAVFIVAKNDLKSGAANKARYYLMKRVIGGKALSQGVIPVVVKVL